MIKVSKNKKQKTSFIWYPEIGERVQIKKGSIPKELKGLNRPVYGKIKDINNTYLSVKISKTEIYLDLCRYDLIPIGDFFYKKNKQPKLKK
jgi:hypothetical protein